MALRGEIFRTSRPDHFEGYGELPPGEYLDDPGRTLIPEVEVNLRSRVQSDALE